MIIKKYNLDVVEKSIKYRTTDLSRLRRKYKPGDRFVVPITGESEEENRKTKRERFVVVKAYPHHLSCRHAKVGYLRSFNYFWLEEHIVGR